MSKEHIRGLMQLARQLAESGQHGQAAFARSSSEELDSAEREIERLRAVNAELVTSMTRDDFEFLTYWANTASSVAHHHRAALDEIERLRALNAELIRVLEDAHDTLSLRYPTRPDALIARLNEALHKAKSGGKVPEP
jgi:hypothetical protein